MTIRDLLIFGATGDLTSRLLVPGLASLAAAGDLPDGFRLIGSTSSSWSTEKFRSHVRTALGEDRPEAAEVLDGLAGRADYQPVDVTDHEAVRRLVHEVSDDSPVAIYLALRLQNHMVQAIWSDQNIECIEVLWEETPDLQGRASFYDKAGALRDVMQNHMMQLLCRVAMEPPADSAPESLDEAVVEVLRHTSVALDDGAHPVAYRARPRPLSHCGSRPRCRRRRTRPTPPCWRTSCPAARRTPSPRRSRQRPGASPNPSSRRGASRTRRWTGIRLVPRCRPAASRVVAVAPGRIVGAISRSSA